MTGGADGTEVGADGGEPFGKTAVNWKNNKDEKPLVKTQVKIGTSHEDQPIKFTSKTSAGIQFCLDFLLSYQFLITKQT